MPKYRKATNIGFHLRIERRAALTLSNNYVSNVFVHTTNYCRVIFCLSVWPSPNKGLASNHLSIYCSTSLHRKQQPPLLPTFPYHHTTPLKSIHELGLLFPCGELEIETSCIYRILIYRFGLAASPVAWLSLPLKTLTVHKCCHPTLTDRTNSPEQGFSPTWS